MKNKYRVVTDTYAGYEVQIKFWWFPFIWFECFNNTSICNTHCSLERAEDFAKAHQAKGSMIFQTKNRVVKYL